MIIKVCGITQPEQYNELSCLNTDMIGFNFYTKSPRYIDHPIHADTNGAAKNVGVFVNATIGNVMDKVTTHKLDFVQLHGDEPPEYCREIMDRVEIIKVFRVDYSFDFAVTKVFDDSATYFLFDTKTPLFGGSGEKFDWQKLNEYTGNTPFIISGGIKPADADEILRIKHDQFAGIDINSGFEESPGIKNIESIKQFLKYIKNEKSR